MQVLTETAPAKINLTLRVLGRRCDGYHEIESLVAFATTGDTLSLAPGDGVTLETDGPFAGALGPGNLVLQAAERVRRVWPEARAGSFHLTKNLPVAAGIGGGSSDAAAALRLLVQANPAIDMGDQISRIAARLGADVTACLTPRAAMMRGIGERLEPFDSFPAAAIVLANPGAALATADVFNALGAPPPPEHFSPSSGVPAIGTLEALIACITASGNDLEAPAMRLAPVIDEVKAALAATRGCLAAALSGSGATCFGLFKTQAEARAAVVLVSQAHPDWWVKASVLQ